MSDTIVDSLLVINQILNAGNAITAFSLLLYALTFTLRERVARAFALVMACVTLSHFADTLVATAHSPAEAAMWLRFQWLAISFLPGTYLHLSDALLAATGRPSRGRRHLAIRISYILGTASWVAVGFSNWVVGDIRVLASASYLQPGPLFPIYGLLLAFCLGLTAANLWRAYKRSLTRTSRRRMRYLIAGSLAPLLSVFPFLEAAGRLAVAVPVLFWGVQVVVNVAVAFMLVLMAYSVAYFGVANPDRVVKSRLFQWILRGPVVASSVLAVTVIVNRLGSLVGLENSRVVPLVMVGSLLLLQFLITLIRPPIERWLFYGEDRGDVERLHLLEERLLTTGDLRQFLESLLNAVCDISGARSAFLAVVGSEGLDLEVAVGPDDPLRGGEELPPLLMTDQKRDIPELGTVFYWDGYALLPVRSPDSEQVVGLLGMRLGVDELGFDRDEAEALSAVSLKAGVALTDRLLQREVFGAVDRLVPQVEAIQKMRAAARYQGSNVLALGGELGAADPDLAQLVRDALGHYWGGPRLTDSPLLGLRVVRETMREHGDSPVNALRNILKRGIEHVRPEGERRFTGDWMLYNILEMKFVEGRKVRDIAMRLAMSEADLYRKQRVAIEAVARAVAEMEREATAQAEAQARP
jgi:hypothetical protein